MKIQAYSDALPRHADIAGGLIKSAEKCLWQQVLCFNTTFQKGLAVRPRIGRRLNVPAILQTKELMKSILALAAATLCTAAIAQTSTVTIAPAKTQTLGSGVKIVHITEGKGASPKATDTVQVHYRGTLLDGKEFDSSWRRGQPASFPLNRVIPCWTEGVQKLKVGGKATLTCPPATAYGDRGAGNAVPPGATLTFEVELLAIQK